MGGHVAALRRISVALFAQHLAVGTGKQRPERMVAVAAGTAGDLEGAAEQRLVITRGSGRRDGRHRSASGQLLAGTLRRVPSAAGPPERSTMRVVEWPGTRSTSITSPPSASTISWPTTVPRGVVAALDQHARLDLPDQLDRRVLLEDHDEIDRFQRRQHPGARMHILHRPLRPLEPLDRGIAVEADHQPIAAPRAPRSAR